MLTSEDFRITYQGCKAHLLAIARKGVPCEADAEDVLHEAFIRFFKKAPNLPRAEDARRYLIRCVVNGVADWWRAVGRRERSCRNGRGCSSPATAASSQAHPADHEEFDSVRMAVSQLPRRQRRAVMLRYFTELPVEEVAAVMECKTATVRSLLRHGVNRLKKILGQQPDAVLE